MNTQEFLELIWPKDAIYLIATKNDRGFHHQSFGSIADAAASALNSDADGTETFFACAGYLRRPWKTEDGRWQSRVKENYKEAKAFWCDIDCGEDKAAKGAGYATQDEAVEAVQAWCADHDVPVPMFVNSGHGIHCYWPLTEAVPAAKWVSVATVLKNKMLEDGVLVDPTRSADFASVLRPLGTHNHKGTPLLVQMWGEPIAPLNTGKFVSTIEVMAPPSDDWLANAPAWMVGEQTEATTVPQMFADAEYSATEMAGKCAQVAHMRDTKGDVSYETWRRIIGLMTFCKEGLLLAEEWSSRRAETGHAQTDTATKFYTWGADPTTCASLEACDSEKCKTCPFHGKIRTPLVLGRVVPEPQVEVVEVVEENDERKIPVTIEIPELPHGYQWDEESKQLIHYVKDKEGKLVPKPFSSSRFYLVARIQNAEGDYEYVVRMHLPRGAVRTFNLPGEIVGKSGSNMLGLLASQEILTTNNNDAGQHMASYLKDQIRKVMNDKEVMPTYTSFGWQDDGSFLIGSRRYLPDGTIGDALLAGYAADNKEALPYPKGTLEGYVDAVNWIYNRAGMEPMQYVICALLASPLVRLYDPAYFGIPVAITGAASGKGKTTACAVALSAFGDSSKLSVAGEAGATVKARAALLGTMSDIPVLFDEVTNMKPDGLSQLAYALSNGMEPMRLRAGQGGVRFADRETWHLQAALTGNTHIGARLAANGQTEAEAMRIFEMRVDEYSIPTLDPLEVAGHYNTIMKNAGCAGEAYIKWLVSHQDEARAIIHEVQDKLKERSTFVANPKYRFFRNHMVLTLACARILKDLNIVKFDLDALAAFADKAVVTLCEAAEENNGVDYMRALSEMLETFQGDILVTDTFKRPKNFEPYQFKPRTFLVGRAIKGDPANPEKYAARLLVSSNAIGRWCIDNRVDRIAFIDALTEAGILSSPRELVRLTTSTNLFGTPQRCWMFDLRRIDGILPEDEE